MPCCCGTAAGDLRERDTAWHHAFEWQQRLSYRQGDSIRLTITPEHVTGAWSVQITQG